MDNSDLALLELSVQFTELLVESKTDLIEKISREYDKLINRQIRRQMEIIESAKAGKPKKSFSQLFDELALLPDNDEQGQAPLENDEKSNEQLEEMDFDPKTRKKLRAKQRKKLRAEKLAKEAEENESNLLEQSLVDEKNEAGTSHEKEVDDESGTFGNLDSKKEDQKDVSNYSGRWSPSNNDGAEVHTYRYGTLIVRKLH